MSRVGSVTCGGEPQLHARPRPSCRPCRGRAARSPSRRVGRFGGSVSGTVSMWPARTTRSGRPSSVRATTVLPSRVTSRWARRRSAASIASASGLLVAADRLDVAEVRGEGDDVADGRGRSSSHRQRRVAAGVSGEDGALRSPRLAPHRAAERSAWGYGLATRHRRPARCSTPGSRAPPLGAGRAGRARTAPRPTLVAAAKEDPRRGVAHRWSHVVDRPRRAAGRRLRRLPAPAPALAPARAAQHHQPRRHLRRAAQRRVDQRRPLRRRRASSAPGCACAQPRPRCRSSASTSSRG